jgi:hypothetical protein
MQRSGLLPGGALTYHAAHRVVRTLLSAQLWRHALTWTAENMLAGFAGIKGRCTIMGRAAMSLDLQQVGRCPWQRHRHLPAVRFVLSQ